MAAPDDIPLDPQPADTSSPATPKPRREIGPEAEVRGGSQADDETLDDKPPAHPRPR
jgi:hypothetical protein